MNQLVSDDGTTKSSLQCWSMCHWQSNLKQYTYLIPQLIKVKPIFHFAGLGIETSTSRLVNDQNTQLINKFAGEKFCLLTFYDTNKG